MHIPIIGIAWLATHITQNPIVIGSFFFVEHVAYGTGVCALLLAMMRLASGADAAVRYATLSTIGIGAVYLPGIWAGWLADKFGYAHYFLLTLLLVPLGVWSAIRASRALDDVTPSVKG
jgi:MFS family permease